MGTIQNMLTLREGVNLSWGRVGGGDGSGLNGSGLMMNGESGVV